MRQRTKSSAPYIAVLVALGAITAYGQATGKPDPANASGQNNPQKIPPLEQRIVVSANLSPAEVEDGKLNELYEAARKLEDQHDCPGAIEKLRALVIPAAEQSKFDVPRSKFLFISYREIADCDLMAGNYAEGEAMYQKSLEFLPVWPGLSDSDYPIILRSIGVSRMDREDWKGAEEQLQKADAVFAQQIEAAVHSDSEFFRTEYADNLRKSQAVDLEFLGVAYFSEGHQKEGLTSLDKAYGEAMNAGASGAVIKRIVQEALGASILAKDTEAEVLWTQRSNAAAK